MHPCSHTYSNYHCNLRFYPVEMTAEQYNKLDSCHFQYDLQQNCEEEIVDARRLLGSNRFDLYAILLYIDHRVRGISDMTYATKIYKERTRVMTGNSFSEKGNKEKNTFSDFTRQLDALIASFQNGTFDECRTFIPVDKDYSLIDGAHRVACAAYFDRKIPVLRFPEVEVHHMTSGLLQKELLPVLVADAMALEAVHWHDDLFMLFLWPKSVCFPEKRSEAIDLIHSSLEVFYEKECKMSYQAIRNLMLQIYGHMEWVGSLDNDFCSTFAKADEVWESNGQCRFVLVKAPNKEYVLNIKSKVRDIMGIGLPFIYSTDNMRETKIAANAIFNPNSFHFLCTAQPTKYKHSYRLYESFKQALEKEKQPLDSFIVDSSMALAIYGAREARDLDYYALSGTPKLSATQWGTDKIEEHDDQQRKFYDYPIEDLICNPAHHFVYNEIKFVSLESLLAFKKKRYQCHHDSKDAADIKLISLLLSNRDNKWQRWLVSASVAIKRRRRQFRKQYYQTRNKVLKGIGLYNLLRRIKKTLKKIVS